MLISRHNRPRSRFITNYYELGDVRLFAVPNVPDVPVSPDWFITVGGYSSEASDNATIYSPRRPTHSFMHALTSNASILIKLYKHKSNLQEITNTSFCRVTMVPIRRSSGIRNYCGWLYEAWGRFYKSKLKSKNTFFIVYEFRFAGESVRLMASKWIIAWKRSTLLGRI